MEIEVNLLLQTGANRGGENLSLLITATHPECTEGELLDALKKLDQDTDHLIQRINRSATQWWASPNSCCSAWTRPLEALFASADGHIESPETEYGFHYRATVEDFRSLVKKKLSDTSNWQQVRKFGQVAHWECRYEHFVDGNAE